MRLGWVGAAANVIATDADVQAHWNRMTSTNATLKSDLETLILGLKDDGIWNKIGILCVAHDNSADSLLNLVGTSINNDSVIVGTATFTANVGFSVSPNAEYISFNETEITASRYNAHDAHIMFYTQTDATANLQVFVQSVPDTAGTPYIIKRAITSPFAGGNFQGTATYIQTSTAPNNGCLIYSCTAQNRRDLRINDEAVVNTANPQAYTNKASTPTLKATQYETGYSAWGLGLGLTAAENALYENRIRTFAQARGFDVY